MIYIVLSRKLLPHQNPQIQEAEDGKLASKSQTFEAQIGKIELQMDEIKLRMREAEEHINQMKLESDARISAIHRESDARVARFNKESDERSDARISAIRSESDARVAQFNKESDERIKRFYDDMDRRAELLLDLIRNTENRVDSLAKKVEKVEKSK